MIEITRKFTNEEFLEKVKSIHGDEFKVISKYINSQSPITVIHKECNRKITYNQAKTLLDIKKCSLCNYKDPSRVHNKGKLEDIKRRVNEIDSDYILTSDFYNNNKEKIRFKHIKCGKEFLMAFNKFQNMNRRCPHCKERSKGETKINKILKENNINFIEEAIFPDCKFERNLRFDFFLPDYNTVIEFDGKQHFQESFGSNKEDAKENLRITKLRDKIKNNYCIEKGIRLYRIPFTKLEILDDEMDHILKELNNN